LRAVTQEWRIRLAVPRVVAAVDDQGGVQLPHPSVEVVVARGLGADNETEPRRIDAGQQDAIDVTASGGR
jgi:hypothetical protein